MTGEPEPPGPTERLSVVTLGVRDLALIRAFYRGLGWRDGGDPESTAHAWFRTAGGLLALYGADALAQEAGFERAVQHDGFLGLSLAVNVDAGRMSMPCSN